MELPSSFKDQMSQLLGTAEASRLIDSLQAETPVCIRLNKVKGNGLRPQEGEEPIPWASRGWYLKNRPAFTFDPLLHAGCYYVQEAGSMFLGQALKQYVGDEPVVMLDLCAAPGGKSTLALDSLAEGSLLVANEIMRQRAQVLAENLTKWGRSNIIVTNSEAKYLGKLTNTFDVLLTDVPCSGEGMFRKDEEAVEQWSTDNVNKCWQRQREILRDIWPALKPGGLLIYSTCTFNTLEDEENVAWIAEELGAEILSVPTMEAWNITGNLSEGKTFPVYRFLPHKTKAEGFFLAVLRKNEEEEEDSYSYESRAQKPRKNDKKGKQASLFGKKELEEIRSWLNEEAGEMELITDGMQAGLFPQEYHSLREAIRSCAKVLLEGTPAAQLKGHDLQPMHNLAMSHLLKAGSFETTELDYDSAIAYLRGTALQLPEGTRKGFVLLTYKGHPLGFCKNIGSRSNNLYPDEWRIRSGYNPTMSWELIEN